MPELEAQDTYVLLYECYNDQSLHGGGENVVLKFLSNKHPFARLLLHEGSIQRKMKIAYELDLWRMSDPVRDWNNDDEYCLCNKLAHLILSTKCHLVFRLWSTT